MSRAVSGEAGVQHLMLTVDEVATLLRTSKKAIYTMIERGQLPGVVRIGRRALVMRAVLVKWLTEKCVPSPVETPR